MQNYAYQSSPNETLLFPEQAIVYASFWERFGAVFIDGLILIVPNYLLQYTMGIAGSLLSIVMYWLYAAFMESGSGQATLGKRALGLKVTDTDGQRISFGQATARHFGHFLSMLILCMGYLMMLWNDKKQTLHDKIANTLVVKSDN